MEREPDYQEFLDKPRFCPRCGTKFIMVTRRPSNDLDELSISEIRDLTEHIYACPRCGYERSADSERLDYVFNHQEWQEKNNALPDIALPDKTHIQTRIYVLGHDAFPAGYLYLYNPFLLAEVSASRRAK